MAKVFTPEEREKIKEQIVEFVRQSGVRRYGLWKLKLVHQGIT